MKRYDMEVLMSKKVAEYLADGYVLNTKSMAGHQGEEGKVDLVKGEKLVRIWMNREHSYNWRGEADKFNGEMLVLRVGVWKYPASQSLNSTVWMKDLDVVDEVTFYEIGRYGSGYYVDSLEAALEAQATRHERYFRNRKPKREIIDLAEVEGARAIAYRYLKRVHGYKRLSWDKILVHRVPKEDGGYKYFVNYGAQQYVLK